jgi:hypothetical protein
MKSDIMNTYNYLNYMLLELWPLPPEVKINIKEQIMSYTVEVTKWI